MNVREKINLPEMKRNKIAAINWIKIFLISIISSELKGCEWKSLYKPVDRDEKYQTIIKEASRNQLLLLSSNGDDTDPVIELM